MTARILLLACVAAVATAASAQGDPAPGSLVGAIDTWRSTPREVIRWCERTNPEGAAARRAIHDAWAEKNSALIKRVDEQVMTVARIVLPPSPGIDVAEAFKAQLLVGRLKVWFSGKSPEQVTAICNMVADPDHLMWSDKMVPMVEEALARLDQFVAQRRGPGQQ